MDRIRNPRENSGAFNNDINSLQRSLFDNESESVLPSPRTRARRTDPLTSHLAAEYALGNPVKVLAMHFDVLAALGDNALTVDQISERLRQAGHDYSHSRVSSAPSELKRLGLIRENGIGLSKRGRPARLWERVK